MERNTGDTALSAVSPLSPDGETTRQLSLVVRYDGTEYHGFQRQENAATIQGELERVLRGLFGPGDAIGGSRTDSGVHAREQIVVWTGEVTVPLERLARVLNYRLPRDIQVVAVGHSARGWDPRRAHGIKHYGYRIWRGSAPPPLEWYRYVYWTQRPTDWEQLSEQATKFMGTHDFCAFRTEGSSAGTTTRHITESYWTQDADGLLWCYHVAGDGFLYRMVRHMVGAMLKAASPEGDRSLIDQGLLYPQVKVTPLAPAGGLTLERMILQEEEVQYVSGSGAGVGKQPDGGGDS